MRCGFVVFERRLVVIDFVEGKERGVGLVLNDVEAAATGLVEDGAGAVFNRGLNKIVDVVCPTLSRTMRMYIGPPYRRALRRGS